MSLASLARMKSGTRHARLSSRETFHLPPKPSIQGGFQPRLMRGGDLWKCVGTKSPFCYSKKSKRERRRQDLGGKSLSVTWSESGRSGRD